MITAKMRADLLAKGFTEDQIKNMTPPEAWQHLGGLPAQESIESVSDPTPGPGGNPTKKISIDPWRELAKSGDPLAAELVRTHDKFILTPPSRAEELTTTPRYALRSAADALKPQPPIEYIVDKLITAGAVCVFYGEPGTKKTYCMVSLAACVARGQPWLEFITNQATVLFIDEESGETRLSRRLGETLRGEGCGPETPVYYVSLAGFRLDDENDPVLLQALIEEVGAKLVIFDALADIMGGDENSKEDTQPIFTQLRKIADRTGAAIILIHHSNRAGGYRGSSAIKGAIDLMVRVESEDGKNIINFETEKNRDGDPQKWGALATWHEQEETFTLRRLETTSEPHYNKSQAYVMRFLEEAGKPMPLSKITSEADSCSPNAARQAVYSLVDLHKVYRTNPKESGQGTEAIYALKKDQNPSTWQPDSDSADNVNKQIELERENGIDLGV
jgi:hypothetical protein